MYFHDVYGGGRRRYGGAGRNSPQSAIEMTKIFLKTDKNNLG